jgi:hypothetical protein
MTRARLLAAIGWFTLGFAVLGVSAPRAQTPAPQPTITIFTDGLAYPNGRMSRAFTELSVALDQGRKLRVLPVMGYGGEGNIRDLLRFRGADMAIVNADALAAPSIDKSYPEARRKLRYITRLSTQKAILLARPDIAAIEQLAGKKVLVLGPETVAKLTAGLVFSLSGVSAELVAVSNGAEPPFAETQAVFFLEEDAGRLPATALGGGTLRAIPIRRNAALSAIYSPAVLAPGEARYAGAQPIDTLAVDTLLASFDWIPSHSRYENVTVFIDRLFAALPKLRTDHPGSIWRQADPRAEVLGWRRHAHAETARKAVPPPPSDSITAVAGVSPAAASPAAARMTGDPALRLSLVAEPPLTDPRSPTGGLITELTSAALQRAGSAFANVALQWDKDRVGQLKGIFSEKRAELGAPWEAPDCSKQLRLSIEAATLCDGGLLSQPLFKVLVVLFIGTGSDLAFTGDDSLIGRTLCLPADRDLGSLSEAGRQHVEAGDTKLVTPATLIDCLSLVQRGEADAVVASDLEGRLTIARLGLAGAFRMAETPVTAKGIHIMLSKDAPGAKERLAALNGGIEKLKGEDLYFQIIAKHLAQLEAGN